MNKMEFNYLCKQIEAIKEALKVVSGDQERRKLFRRLEGLRLLQSQEVNKMYGIFV